METFPITHSVYVDLCRLKETTWLVRSKFLIGHAAPIDALPVHRMEEILTQIKILPELYQKEVKAIVTEEIQFRENIVGLMAMYSTVYPGVDSNVLSAINKHSNNIAEAIENYAFITLEDISGLTTRPILGARGLYSLMEERGMNIRRSKKEELLPDRQTLDFIRYLIG